MGLVLPDFFATSPLEDPLSYPGLIPSFSYVLTGPRSLLACTPADLPLLAQRHPVLAVGSNAAPGQLARKFAAVGCFVPVLRAVAPGLRVLASAHINVHGYVPSAPLVSRGACAAVFVTFLDDRQLLRLDETEPNYVRVPCGPVRLDDGTPVAGCQIYRSRQGVLTDPRVLEAGSLPAQPVLLARLIALLPQVRAAGILSADDLVAAVRSGRVDPAWVTAQMQRVLQVSGR